MTEDEKDATIGLDLHLRRMEGAWHLECRKLAMEADGTTLDEAATKMLTEAREGATALGATVGSGYLTAAGQRRLAKLRTLVDVLGRLRSVPASGDAS